ncbi:MAG: hypothetical protein K0U68_04600 [Gammaproteobacteria bacterium]|nr:hypothetical protein [Gammaproteobacteria bacterium]
MIRKRGLPIILTSITLCLLLLSTAHARGILGPDPGDRSSDQNTKWLKSGIDHLHQAIKAADGGDQENSLKHGKESILSMKEIASEGWAPKLEKSFSKLRSGINASKKGDLAKASENYQLALKRVESLKFGDLIWTHEAFLGIGDHRKE